MATTPEVGRTYRLRNKAKPGSYLAHAHPAAKDKAPTFAPYPANVNKTVLLLNPSVCPEDTGVTCQKSYREPANSFTTFDKFSMSTLGASAGDRDTDWYVTADGDHVRLRSAANSKYLWVDERQIMNEKVLYCAVDTEKRDDGLDMWTLEEVQAFDKVLAVKDQPAPTIKVPKLTDGNQPPQYTEMIEAGKAVVPWTILGDDEGHDIKWRREQSPYVIIRRQVRWKLVGFTGYPANTQEQFGVTTTVGVQEQKTEEIDKTLNISVSREAGMDIKGFSAKARVTVQAGLHIKVGTTTTKSYSESRTYTKTVGPAKNNFHVAGWIQESVYTWYYADGREFFDYVVADPNRYVASTYPDAPITGRTTDVPDLSVPVQRPPETVSVDQHVPATL
ncbi:hypothetical protein [Actinophytocola glycyrrhizae]|uniref:Insecticidal crystal toxin domain-containing protein n=1 Tax=Actinophytocola glycyrrhizae TaxID=2044873 RepID=A0ABV9RVI7_9PSEU